MSNKLKIQQVSLFLLILLVGLILFGGLITAPEGSGSNHKMGGYLADIGNSWIGLSQWQATFGDKITAEESMWNPVQPWEVQQCKKKLSTQIWSSKTGDGLSSASPLLFDLTVTLQAEQRTLSYEKGLYENSVSWYVQHYQQDVQYSLILIDDQGHSFDVPKEGTGPIKNKKADHVSGGAGFIAWEGKQKYAKAELNMEIKNQDGSANFTQSYVVDFVSTANVVN